jgi:acyl-CoA thioesterase-2
LHAFFIGVGEMEAPFSLTVEKIRDGGSFATRRVEIHQGARLLLTGHTSHHDGDDGPDGQLPMPDVPPPERLEDQRVTRANRAGSSGNPMRTYLSESLLDARPILLTHPARARAVWFRPRMPIEGGCDIHQAVIGFASDSGLVHVGVHTYAQDVDLQAASLDHTIRFHRDSSANDWMLHVQTSPSMAQGRGFSQAAIYTRGGVLVASVAQEILARKQRSLESK